MIKVSLLIIRLKIKDLKELLKLTLSITKELIYLLLRKLLG